MSVSNNDPRRAYNGDGVSVAFSTPLFLSNSDLKVYVGGVLKTITTDYSVTGAGVASGGTVTFVSPPAAGTNNVVIVVDPDLLQKSSLPTNDPFPSKTVETALDKLTIIAQRVKDLINRSFVLSDSDTSGASLSVPSPVPGKLIGWSADGKSLVNTDKSAVGAGSITTVELADSAISDKTHAATSKSTPIDADELPLVDSASSYGLKKLTWFNLKAGIWSALGSLIMTGTGKATPVDADYIPLADSAAGNATKSLSWANIKATLKTYFDTLYQAKIGTVSMVRLYTANGYGSTNTCIRRFTNTVTSQGSDITYADSATLGGSFTINTAGVYVISYSDCFTTANGWMGISKDTATPTTQINGCANAEILGVQVTTGANLPGSCSWAGYLPAGAVVRAHGQAGLTNGSGSNAQFTIARAS